MLVLVGLTLVQVYPTSYSREMRVGSSAARVGCGWNWVFKMLKMVDTLHYGTPFPFSYLVRLGLGKFDETLPESLKINLHFKNKFSTISFEIILYIYFFVNYCYYAGETFNSRIIWMEYVMWKPTFIMNLIIKLTIIGNQDSISQKHNLVKGAQLENEGR